MMFALVSMVLAADPNTPHPHQGVLTPYKGAPPAIPLTDAEQATLAAGSQVMKQFQSGSGGRAVAIMDITASTDTVWSKILAFSSYPSWVEGVSECGVYKTEGSNIYTRFLLSMMGVSVEYYVKHTLNKAAGYMTWTLDYSRTSDLDDSVGFWRVTAQPTGKTRLEYSVEVRLSSWIPDFMANLIRSKGVSTATMWVKKQSE